MRANHQSGPWLLCRMIFQVVATAPCSLLFLMTDVHAASGFCDSDVGDEDGLAIEDEVWEFGLIFFGPLGL